MIDRSLPVAIVGAGIAGLSAALAFAKGGFDVELFERAPKLEEAGAGIQLSPNALRALGSLGLGPALSALGVAARSVRLRSGRTGRPIAEVPVTAADGTAYLSIHRADLQQALYEAARKNGRIAIRLGHELADLARSETGIRLFFRHDSSAVRQEFPLVLGADGIRSLVSGSLGGGDAEASGSVAWRMMLDIGESERRPEAGIEAWLGPGRHAVAYPVRGGRKTNLVLIAPTNRAAPGGTGDRERLLAAFRGWDERLLDMVRRAGPVSAWPIASTPADRPWHDGERRLLIGDAAHAMRPYAAQGAAMAIEDAVVAGYCFATSPDHRAAIGRYAGIRRPRIDRVRRRVAFHRLVYHLPFPLSLGRDAVLAARSQEALRRDLAWLYDWAPPEP